MLPFAKKLDDAGIDAHRRLSVAGRPSGEVNLTTNIGERHEEDRNSGPCSHCSCVSAAAFAAGPEKNLDPSIIEQNKQKKEWMSQGGEREEALHLKPNYDNGREVYEVCSACHMPEGWGLPDGTFPQVAGQHREVIIKQLADIRDGHRDNPTMYPFALPSEIGGTQSIAGRVGIYRQDEDEPEERRRQGRRS
jgi:cytochrome c553